MAQITWTNQTEIDAAALDAAKDAKITELKNACSNDIFAGFISSVAGPDGQNYEFGFNGLDQQNFDQVYLLVVSGDNAGAPIDWKTKSHGVIQMDEAQFKTVVMDAKTHKLLNQQQYWQLEADVLAAYEAKDKAAIEAIVWA